MSREHNGPHHLIHYQLWDQMKQKIEAQETALEIARDALKQIKDQENIYSEGCECEEVAHDCLKEIAEVLGDEAK